MSSKKEYIEDLESQLEKWDRRVSSLYDRADNANLEERKELIARVGAIKDQMSFVQVRLDAVRDVEGHGWAIVKNGLDDVRMTLSATVEVLVSRVEKFTSADQNRWS